MAATKKWWRKKTYQALLQEDVSDAKVLEARAVETTDGVSSPEGWELKLATKSTRFNEGQN